MPEEISNTDVTAGSPASESAPEGADASAPGSAGEGSESIGTEAEAAEETGAEGGSAAPSPVPENDDDLSGQDHNPHVQGLKSVRQHARTLQKDLDERRPLEAYREFSKYGGPEQAKEYAEIGAGLYTPVTDPRTGEVLRDPNTGLPRTTTVPALDRLRERSPETYNQLASDMLNQEYEGDTLLRQAIRQLGYDPDVPPGEHAPSAQAGNVDPSELDEINEEYHDAYKSLSPKIREEFEFLDDVTKDQILQDRKESLDNKAFREQSKREKAEAQQQKAAEFHRSVEAAQRENLVGLRKEIHASILETLSKQWQPTSSKDQNDAQYGVVMGTLMGLLEPEFRFASEGLLKAAGVKIDSKFDEALNTLAVKSADYKRFEAHKDQVHAARARAEMTTARLAVQAKFGDIATKIVAVMSGKAQPTAKTPTRPALAAGAPPPRAKVTLPPGVRPGSQAAIEHLWQQTMGDRGVN